MYILFHVGKSGGATFNKFLTKNKINYNILHVHTSKQNNIKILNNNNNNKIIFLRDPISRYMSVFYYWLRAHNYYISNKKHVHLNIVKNNIKYFSKIKTFQDLVTELRTGGNLKNLAENLISNMHHLRQNLSYYLGDNKIIEKNKNKILFIMEQENYDKDFNDFNIFLNKKHNTPIDGNFCSTILENYINQRNSNGCKEDLYFLSEENKIFLKKYLSSEYKIYEYLKSIKEEVNGKIKK